MITISTAPLTIDAAIAALAAEAERQGGCPYELWIVRLNLEGQRLAAAVADRDGFIARATAEGLMDPQADAAWILEPTDDHCAHGLDPACCPCGCGHIDID